MLHQHIIRALLALFLSTLIISGVVSYFTIKNNNMQKYQHVLQTYTKVIKNELPNINDLSKFANSFKEASQIRLTLMDEHGAVLAESDTQVGDMENHLRREEIVKAQKEEFGSAVRHSKTLNSDLLYVAHYFNIDEKKYFIRLATSISKITNDFYDLWIKITLIFSLSIIAGLYGAYRLSKKIRQEIDKIIINLQQIADKEYKISLSSHFSLEFLEIANYLKKLASKLEKRAKQKRKYTAKIKLISKQRSDVISAISHEFKNPIASILGYAQTLLDDPNAAAPIKERFLGKIAQNAQKISTMIDRLALTTKFENGDFSTQNSTFDIAKLASEVAQTFREKHHSRNILCELPDSYTITADKTMMELVISNLIDNALKYSKDEVIVKIEADALHIKDFGIGIAEEDIEKVSQKFYRSNTHSWDNSMGLGLALVSYILKLHGTTLDIKSVINEGSDFSFKLTQEPIS